MRRRVPVALLIGLVLGLVATFGGVFALGRGTAAVPPPALGDPAHPWDLEVVVTDALLTTQLRQPPCGATAPSGATPAGSQGRRSLRDPSVQFRADGTIQVNGTASLYGLPLRGRAVLQPRVIDGHLEFAVVSSEIGRFKLPTTAGDQLVDALNQQLRASMAAQPFQLTALTPGAGTLGIRVQLTGPPAPPPAPPATKGC